MASDSKVLYGLAVEGGIFLVVVVMFSILYRRFPAVYNPRHSTLMQGDGYSNLVERIFSQSDASLISMAGVDGFALLLFLRLIMWMFAAFGIYGLIVLIPINYYGELNTNGLESISMSNIEPSSDYIWAHLVSAYLYTGVAMYLAYYYTSVAQRARFESLKSYEIEHYTTIVQGIPTSSRSQEGVRQFFDQIYGSDILGISVAQVVKELPEVIQERVEAIEKLHVAEHEFQRTGEPVIQNIGFLGLLGPEVEACSYYQQKIQDLTHGIKALREGMIYPPADSGTAFVTFRNPITCILAAQSLHHLSPSCWIVQKAPHPDDVFWQNINIPLKAKYLFWLLGETATFFFVIFYAVPISFIAALSNAKALSKDVEFLEVIAENDFLRSIFEGLLPAVLLIAFDICTPLLLIAITKFQGVNTYTEIDSGLLCKFYGLQIFNVFFVTLIAGSVFDSLSDIIDEPSDILDLLGSSIPQVSSFFMVYILLQTLVSLPMSMLRIGPLLTFYYTHSISNMTEMQKENSVRPQLISFGSVYPQLLLVLLISITYSTIAPVIIPVAFSFFAMNYFVYAYQLIFCVVSRCDTGGTFWPIAIRRLIFALIIYQLTLTGYFSIKLAAQQTPLMFPLIAATIVFYSFMERQFFDNWVHLPLIEGVHLRKFEQYDSTLYQNPALSSNREHLLCNDFKYAKILLETMKQRPEELQMQPHAISPSVPFGVHSVSPRNMMVGLVMLEDEHPSKPQS
eukprot:TRINITY_DN10651_c0_g1_i1.p1 TRINITY_DN10651_c0_g1~~TRINITY_DN10651_c0_g1_i1.p1  ORF type:complete len:737 (-),score=121.95 TRINITY_DN10651_c0_g1_i1:103-2313(-)